MTDYASWWRQRMNPAELARITTAFSQDLDTFQPDDMVRTCERDGCRNTFVFKEPKGSQRAQRYCCSACQKVMWGKSRGYEQRPERVAAANERKRRAYQARKAAS